MNDDLVVYERKRGWAALDLHGLWAYRELLYFLTWRDILVRYKQAVLGVAWAILQPLLTMIVFTVVFNMALGIKSPASDLPYAVFSFTGLLPWQFFAGALSRSGISLVGNASLLTKVYFPRLAVPVSILISNLITFLIQFVLFLAFVIYFLLSGTPIQLNWMWIALSPVLLLMMAGLGLGLGIIVSSLTTKYRDLRFLVQFGVQLLMYAIPVIYPVSSIPARFQWIILANPMTPIVEAFRYAFLGAGTVDLPNLAYSFGFMLVVVFIGTVIFNRVEATFMDTV